jgi:hypothetical protein
MKIGLSTKVAGGFPVAETGRIGAALELAGGFKAGPSAKMGELDKHRQKPSRICLEINRIETLPSNDF